MKFLGTRDEIKVLLFGDNTYERIANLIHREVKEKPKDLKEVEMSVLEPMWILFDECKMHHTSATISHGGFYANYDLSCFGAKNSYIVGKIKDILTDQIDLIRIDAINAIYNACILSKYYWLSDHEISQVQKCLNDPSLKFRGLAFKLLSSIDNPNVDFTKMFENSLQELENDTQNADNARNYICAQALNPMRCEKLFTKNTINRLVSLIESKKGTSETKL
jgi:hypothetical protein